MKKLLVSLIVFTSCTAPEGQPHMAGKLLDSLYVSGYGTAAASGTVNLYGVGTLVPVTVFSDDALTQTIVQPITLDSNGRTPLPVYTTVPVRAIIKSSAGATLADIARLDGDRAELVAISNSAATSATDLNSYISLIATSTGTTDGKFLDAGPGAVPRTIAVKFAEVQISVKDYGAKGDGVTDDTTAIQAAINRVVTLGGGVVFFPPGTYLISASLSITSAGVDLLGAGPSATIIKQTNATANAIFYPGGPTGTTSNRLSSLSVVAATTSTGSAISANANVVGPIMTSVAIGTGFRFGISANLGTVIISASSITANSADASSIAVKVSTGASVIVDNSVVSVTGSSISAITNSGVATNLWISNSNITSATLGLQLTTTTGNTNVSSSSIAGSTHAVSVSASTSGAVAFSSDTTFPTGDILDSRTTNPPVFTLSGTGAITPLPLVSQISRIVQSGAGATTTINAPAAAFTGTQHTIICSNTSGGALTWTFNAAFVTSAAVAPATGTRVMLTFVYDAVSTKWYELTRAATNN